MYRYLCIIKGEAGGIMQSVNTTKVHLTALNTVDIKTQENIIDFSFSTIKLGMQIYWDNWIAF